MGFISMTVLTSFTLFVAYTLLITGTHAAAISNEVAQQSDEAQHKRQPSIVWLKTLPLRRMKPMNAYSAYRRDFQPSDVEILDDSINTVDKRFDDYGHMR